MRTINNKFDQYFKNSLEEVFLYILDLCNYRCVHCYMGEVRNKVLSLEEIKSILFQTYKLGARKLTIIGGEPTLHKNIFEVIDYAKNIGFELIILDTNGSFPMHFFDNPIFKMVDILSISLDCYNDTYHDEIRCNKGAFDKAVQRIKVAKNTGYKVRITCTISRKNENFIIQFLDFINSLNIDFLNFHLVTNNGFVESSQELLINPHEWNDIYKKILEYYNKFTPTYKLCIPVRYCSIEQFKKIKDEHHCLSAFRKRILVYPDRKVYTCSLLGHTENYIATFENNRFVLNKKYKEKIKTLDNMIIKNGCIGCPEMADQLSSHFVDYKNGLVSLCISYKPSKTKQ